MDTFAQDTLKERAASLVDSAYEAGYDDAAGVAYDRGWDDGYDYAKREIAEQEEAIAADAIRSVLDTFALGDPADLGDDECTCPDCLADAEEDLAQQAYGLLNEVNDDLGEVEAWLNDWAPVLTAMVEHYEGFTQWVEGFASSVGEFADDIEARVELAEADAVLLESLEARLARLEADAYPVPYAFPLGALS